MVRKWDDILIERLKDKEQAIAYLNTALEDTKDGSPESQELLLIALRNIAKAQGGFTLLAKSKRVNPKITTLISLISALGFELQVTAKNKR